MPIRLFLLQLGLESYFFPSNLEMSRFFVKHNPLRPTQIDSFSFQVCAFFFKSEIGPFSPTRSRLSVSGRFSLSVDALAERTLPPSERHDLRPSLLNNYSALLPPSPFRSEGSLFYFLF